MNTTYHEKILIPTYHVTYDVCVSENLEEAAEHMKAFHPGLKFNVNPNAGGYTCLIKNADHSMSLVVLINTNPNLERGSLNSTIVHEATHLSWYILDGLGMKIDSDNHEVQAYLMEDLCREITRVTTRLETIVPIESKDDLSNL